MKPVKMRSAAILSTFLLTLLANGCTQDSPSVATPTTSKSNAATVRVLLMDAPADYIAAAEVAIGTVELISADGQHVKLTDNGTNGFVNLLDFQAPATTPIADATIDPGSFTQMRLIVDSARVQLAPGYAFKDGSTEKALKVPSGMQTGIKLNLQGPDGGPLSIVPGQTVLVLDFNVDKSFVLQGNPTTPAGIHGVIFTPTIKVTGQNVAASISGTISTSLQGQSVEGLTVRAVPTDAGTAPGYTAQTDTAVTDSDGNYTMPYLVPATYNVTVDLPAGLSTDPASQAVTLADGQDTTGVNFDVINVRGSISGTVSTSLTGVKVDSLTVTAVPQTAGLDTVRVRTASDGTFKIDSILPGSYVVTVAVADTLVTTPLWADVNVGNSQDVTGVDFAIVQPGSIAGTVTTSLSGVSVAGLTVTATASGEPSLTTTTASDGTYTFGALPAGTWTITVTVGQGYTTNPTSLSINLTAGTASTGNDFDVVASS
jgi:hypothetical protein